ncbi:MAG: hypothetical protein HKN73_20535 [Gemmatimonadetes bacterium]|nr:hypothetical protein [Gemmatimonadota bacterium]
MILFHAGRQAVKVRWLWVLSLMTTVLLAGAALYFLAQAGPGPAEGPDRRRAHLFAILAAIGGAVCSGLAVYVRTYVTRIVLEGDGKAILISTLGWVGERTTRLDPSCVEEGGFHQWRTRTVDAPWWTLWVRGRYLPLIVDAQGDIPDLPRLLKVLGTLER